MVFRPHVRRQLLGCDFMGGEPAVPRLRLPKHCGTYIDVRAETGARGVGASLASGVSGLLCVRTQPLPLPAE